MIGRDEHRQIATNVVSSSPLLLEWHQEGRAVKGKEKEEKKRSIEMTLDELLTRKAQQKRPTIVCLCGSTRFIETFQQANLRETLDGHIVLSVGCDTYSDEMLGLSSETKIFLDTLHLWKIDLCDEVYVLNLGGYIGDSTAREIAYAQQKGKPIRYLHSSSSSS